MAASADAVHDTPIEAPPSLPLLPTVRLVAQRYQDGAASQPLLLMCLLATLVWIVRCASQSNAQNDAASIITYPTTCPAEPPANCRRRPHASHRWLSSASSAVEVYSVHAHGVHEARPHTPPPPALRVSTTCPSRPAWGQASCRPARDATAARHTSVRHAAASTSAWGSRLASPGRVESRATSRATAACRASMSSSQDGR